MLIRSQDKKSIMNLDNIMRINVIVPPMGITERMIMANGAELGAYSTEEKAIEVLDMICQSYRIMKSCDCSMNGISKEFKDASKELINELSETIRSLYVFQMPQDSEV